MSKVNKKREKAQAEYLNTEGDLQSNSDSLRKSQDAVFMEVLSDLSSRYLEEENLSSRNSRRTMKSKSFVVAAN